MKTQKPAAFLIFCAAVLAAAIVIGRADPPGTGGGEKSGGFFAGFGEKFEIPDDENSVGSPFKYYCGSLSENEKKAYFAILSEAEDMPESIAIPPLDNEELDRMLEALLLDNPELFFLGSKCRAVTTAGRCECSFTYTMTGEEYTGAKRKLEFIKQEVASLIKDPEDEWQTELIIHDYIVNNCEYLYDSSESVANAAGALIQKKASCSGYAKAFKYLLDSFGIENYLVAGDGTDTNGKTEAHLWSVVRINGVLCHTDITWDDPVGTNSSNYDYFNITDSDINLDHKNWSFGEPCISDEQSWHRVNGVLFSSFGSEEKESAAAVLADELSRGRTGFSIRFTSKGAYQKACDELISDGGVYELLKSAAKKTDVTFSTRKLSYNKNDKKMIITVYPRISH